MTALDLISQGLAAPKTHRVTTLYACGKIRTHDTASEKQAENFATGERRKIGKDLIDRDSGFDLTVVSVTVGRIS